MLDIEKNQNRTTHLYMEVYEYYRKLILDGKMTPGAKCLLSASVPRS